uniref:Uncharacterized protein n=1 Tax=Oryza brachyantha TaxID=4533 RepID=J3N9N8_ORYBR
CSSFRSWFSWEFLLFSFLCTHGEPEISRLTQVVQSISGIVKWVCYDYLVVDRLKLLPINVEQYCHA